jgi:type I restriction enzyme, S subunit
MTTQAVSKLPSIRFNGLKGEWEKKTLGSICTIGDVDHWMPETTSSGIPYVMTGDFYGINEIDFENAKLISETDFEKLTKKIKPELGDILFARYASVGAVRYIRTTRKFIVSYSCAILKYGNSFNSEYLFFLLQSDKIQNRLKESINTGSQGNIGTESLRQLICRFPQITEQTKIGTYFRELDSLIDLHQHKHDKLVTLKKAMLQKMFPQAGATTPEIRFKGFEGEWVEKRFGEFMGVGSVKRIHQSDWTKSGVRFLRARDIVSAYKNEDPADVLYISQAKYEEYSVLSGKVELGDLLVTGVGTIGIPYLITKIDPVYFKDGNIIWFKNNGTLNGDFIYYSFIGERIQKYIKESAGTGTVGTYTISSGKDTPLSSPLLEEQKKIGTYFRTLDALIAKHAIQLQKLKQIKSACLEKMFV